MQKLQKSRPTRKGKNSYLNLSKQQNFVQVLSDIKNREKKLEKSTG